MVSAPTRCPSSPPIIARSSRSPRRHAAGFEHASETEQRDLAGVLRAVLRRLDRAIGDPSFTMVVHSAPFLEAESPSYHWHVEITPLLPHADHAWSGGLPLNAVP